MRVLGKQRRGDREEGVGRWLGYTCHADAFLLRTAKQRRGQEQGECGRGGGISSGLPAFGIMAAWLALHFNVLLLLLLLLFLLLLLLFINI